MEKEKFEIFIEMLKKEIWNHPNKIDPDDSIHWDDMTCGKSMSPDIARKFAEIAVDCLS